MPRRGPSTAPYLRTRGGWADVATGGFALVAFKASCPPATLTFSVAAASVVSGGSVAPPLGGPALDLLAPTCTARLGVGNSEKNGSPPAARAARALTPDVARDQDIKTKGPPHGVSFCLLFARTRGRACARAVRPGSFRCSSPALELASTVTVGAGTLTTERHPLLAQLPRTV